MSEEPTAPLHPSDFQPTNGQLFLPQDEKLFALPHQSLPTFEPEDPLKILKDSVHNPLDRLAFQEGAREISEETFTVEALKLAMLEIQRLKHEINHDELTGIYNRNGLKEKARELEKAGKPIGVAIVDLDHFKTVNDTLGHDAGDQVLTAFAGAMSSSVREGDSVGRWGGDEFAILVDLSNQRPAYTSDHTPVTKTLESTTKEIAQRLDGHFQLLMLPRPELEKAGLGYSIGWGVGPTFDEARLKADVAMYEQKAASGLSDR